MSGYKAIPEICDLALAVYSNGCLPEAGYLYWVSSSV